MKVAKTGMVLLLFCSNPFFCNEALRLWEPKPVPIRSLEVHDAAVLLSGVTYMHKEIPDRVSSMWGAERIFHTIALYRAGKVKQIIVSGGSGKVFAEAVPESIQIKNILLQAGIPGKDILTEEHSRNTFENAVFTKTLLQQHPQIKSLVLVTSAFHMPRAMGCFQKAGIPVTSFPTDFYFQPRNWDPDDWLIPNERSLVRWQQLLHEMAGYLVYQFKGYQ
ncbi:YdcF family protein [Cnuella takakiae]|nr:YdcF family protein [Cnuella takakiae]